jgi:hypothetical protein
MYHCPLPSVHERPVDLKKKGVYSFYTLKYNHGNCLCWTIALFQDTHRSDLHCALVALYRELEGIILNTQSVVKKRFVGFGVGLFLAYGLSGCDSSEQLSRETAGDMLQRNIEYPFELKKALLLYQFRSPVLILKEYAEVVNKSGFGTAKIGKPKGRVGNVYRNHLELEVELNEDGKRFIRGDVYERTQEKYIDAAAYAITFGEVTGISFQNAEKTKATVEYTEVYTPTALRPLFDALPYRPLEDSVEDRAALFQLYDDGWRLIDVPDTREGKNRIPAQKSE